MAKYCGAGVAALGLSHVERAHAGALAVPDLDEPVQSGMWRMRDAQCMQYGEFIKNAPYPRIMPRKNLKI